uniref:Uncharacterized protein n=1 Tax=Arundo donax TaxID=35708 RepID=A0A0A9HRW3_ARUDO
MMASLHLHYQVLFEVSLLVISFANCILWSDGFLLKVS